MQHSDFVHLHVHSEYSLLDGAAQLEKLVAKAKELKFPAIALTDHGNLFGAIDFYQAAQKGGIKPIVGCELYVAPRGRKERGGEDGGYEGANHLTVLVGSLTGYKNLIKLVSRAYLEGFYYKPRVDKELLAEHADGLLVLSGCLNSEVSRLISAGEVDRAREAAGWHQEVFGKDHYFMEVQAHGLDEQTRVTAETLKLAQAIGAPIAGTNDSHYLEAGHGRAHEALLCIQTGSTLLDPKRWRFSTEEFYVKSAEEMARVFAEIPDACRNTLAVAERCNLTLEFGSFHLPRYVVPENHTLESYLEHLAREGLQRRYGANPGDAIDQRLGHELRIIEKMGFAGYFLVVWDFIRYARDRGIAVGPGRGSSAGSLVAYCLGITNVDPMRYGLLFERFLNPERISMPDMDIDFADDRRDEGIRYVAAKYGHDRVARRHLRRLARRAHSALQGPQAAGVDHRLRHGADREARPAQDGLPRLADAPGAGQHRGLDPRLPRGDHRPRRAAARRRQELCAAHRRADVRRVPAGIGRHARCAAWAQAVEPRGRDRDGVALPAGPDGADPGFHQSQARPGQDHLRAPGDAEVHAGYVRDHGVPRADHADRQRDGRFHDGRGRHAAAGHGQEGSRSHGQAARQDPGRLRREGHGGAQGRARVGA